MDVPLVDLRAQYKTIKGEVDLAIQQVLDEGQFIQGPAVRDFEDAFARYIGADGAVGVGSGTAALHLALLACEIGPGDEVITASHTFAAIAEAICHTGARPVFAEIDPTTYCLEPSSVEAAITSRTRAVVPVHLYGQPADMDPLMAIAERHDLMVIEDAAQAHGAEYKGRRCGAIGHLGCFSFYPGKNLGAYGDAGAVTGNNTDLLTRVRTMRDHGRTAKYEHVELGYAERLDTLQAAVLNVKLSRLDDWVAARRDNADAYGAALADSGVVPPMEVPGLRHAYHLYVVRAPRRDALLAHLRRAGVGAGIHYPTPVHRQPALVRRGYGSVGLPETERAAAEVLSLPMYPELTSSQITYVAETIKEFYR
jgi:dTDP-4-amino-4,6-dideoxygalactose transaminase